VSEKELYEKMVIGHLLERRDDLSRLLANADSIYSYTDISRELLEINDKIDKFRLELDNE
jgi:hypothetical protein